MQRPALLSFAIVAAIAAGGTALAGPLNLNPELSANAARSAAQPRTVEQRGVTAIFTAPPADDVQPLPVRQAAAERANYGGGFLELLFRGPSGARSEHYRHSGPPADMGPGVVESPSQPGRLVVDPRYMRQLVSYQGDEAPGTVIINTRERLLYLVQGNGQALRYGIGVGRPGFTWSGTHHISQKREWPDWTPPEEMLRRQPDLPRHMAGGPDNPLGARALYLGSTLYRIHGSNEPWTIGTQVSSGCIRMRNEDVVDLYSRVKIGTKVVVL
jgi:lipoprotein-anchoring transpeptidase ErfK/SrfK